MIYIYTWLLISVIYLIAPYFIKDKEKKRKICIMISFFILFLVSAFRGDVGNDLKNYLYLCERVKLVELSNILEFSQGVHYEIGFVIFTKVITMISGDLQFFVIVTSFIIMFLFGRIVYKFSPLPWISITIFILLNFYTSSFNIIRQYLATGIVLNMIPLILDKKMIKFFCVVIFASLFHKGSLIYIPFYIIARNKISLKNILLYGVGLLFFLLFFDNFSEVLIRILYSDYLGESGINEKLDVGLVMLVPVVIMLATIFFTNDLIHINEMKNRILINAAIVSAVLFILSSQIILIKRFSEYFSIIYILLIPELILCIKDKNMKIVISFCIIIAALLYFYILTIMVHLHGALPYEFFFQQ